MALGARPVVSGRGIGHIELETMVAQQPDMIVMQQYGYARHTQGEAMLEHPVLQNMSAIRIPVLGAWLVCPHLYIHRVAEHIQKEWQP